MFGFAFTWMFMLIGVVSGSAQAAQGMSLLVFPLTFVSSAYVPVDTMPGWMQAFARNQPITVMVDAVRAWVIGDPVAALGHSAWYFTIRALLWSAAAGPGLRADRRRPLPLTARTSADPSTVAVGATHVGASAEFGSGPGHAVQPEAGRGNQRWIWPVPMAFSYSL